MTSSDRPSTQPRTIPLLALLMFGLASVLAGCGLFGSSDETIDASGEVTDDESGTEFESDNTDDDDGTKNDNSSSGSGGGSDNGNNEGNTVDGESNGQNNDLALAAVDEEQALSVIQEASVETGVAPDQRAGVSGYTPIIRCADAENLTSDELESLSGTYFFLCIEVEVADVWSFKLVGPDGQVVHQQRNEDGTYDYSLSLLDPFGAYRLEGTSRNGGSVDLNYEFGAIARLVLEAVTVDGDPALAISGYGDATTIELAAYDASRVEARRFNDFAQPPRISFSGDFPLLYELGSFDLDPNGLTVIPLSAADIDQFCIFDANGPGLVTDPSACWGLEVIDSQPPIPLPDDNRFQLTRTLVDELGRQDLAAIAPLNTTLADGTMLSAATVVQLTTGNPIGAAGFVTDPANGKVYVHSWVEEPDMVSAFASVCANLDAIFDTPSGACSTEAPKLLLEPPLVIDRVVQTIVPLKPTIVPELFKYPLFIDNDLFLNPTLWRQLQLQPDLLSPNTGTSTTSTTSSVNEPDTDTPDGPTPTTTSTTSQSTTSTTDAADGNSGDG